MSTDKRTIFFDPISAEVKKWFLEKKLNLSFDKIYIFGSLINRNGRHFIPRGATTSDIDLVMVFAGGANEAKDRFESCKQVRNSISSLEGTIVKILSWQNAGENVFSVLPLTRYEMYHCIHKGFDPKIFTSNIFYEVITEEWVTNGLTDYIDFSYHLENVEAFSAMRLCQKIRNDYLAIAINGNERLQSFTGDEEVPKEIMRTAALLNYIDKDSQSGGLRTDLEEGLKFLMSELQLRKDKDPLYRTLEDKVSSRGFSRADSAPLLADDVLLLAEILYDSARRRVQLSVREAIDTCLVEGFYI